MALESSLLRDLTLSTGDYLSYDLGALAPADGGRVVDLTLRLADVPPDRRVAVSVTLTERDPEDRESPRGVRTCMVPAHHDTGPRDIEISPLRFVLPAELDLSGGGARQLTVRADAHYIDRNGVCQPPDRAEK